MIPKFKMKKVPPKPIEVPTFTQAEIRVIKHLIERRTKVLPNGNNDWQFSEISFTGPTKKLLNTLLGLEWIYQTGWYLTGKGCFAFSDNGLKATKKAMKNLPTMHAVDAYYGPLCNNRMPNDPNVTCLTYENKDVTCRTCLRMLDA